jgi:hypothetical protein
VEGQHTEFIKDMAARALPAVLEALWALGERSEGANTPARAVKLRAPWSNVQLIPSESLQHRVPGTPRIAFPLSSARMAELRWRGMRPRIPLHDGVLTLLTGASPKQSEFRAVRDEIVDVYRRFLETNGNGYSGIGLAIPFLR